MTRRTMTTTAADLLAFFDTLARPAFRQGFELLIRLSRDLEHARDPASPYVAILLNRGPIRDAAAAHRRLDALTDPFTAPDSPNPQEAQLLFAESCERHREITTWIHRVAVLLNVSFADDAQYYAWRKVEDEFTAALPAFAARPGYETLAAELRRVGSF